MTDTEYIENRLRDQQTYFSSKASKYKTKYFTISIVTLILSALITVLTAASSTNSSWQKILIAVSSSSITVLSGILTLCKFQERWLQYRTIAEQLKSIDFLYAAKVAPYDNEDTAFESLVTSCENVINDSHSKWLAILSEKNANDTYSTSS